MPFLSGSKCSIMPSILNADFGHLAQQVKLVEDAGVEGLHLDIMDGHFVPNISFGPGIVAQVNEITNLPLDVHLMISSPDKYIKSFADAGADNITVHQEACSDLRKTIKNIHVQGINAGVSISPDTPVETISTIIDEIELVLIMSVYPGFGGQSFLPDTIDKLSELRNLVNGRHPELLIQVDGGLDLNTVPSVIQAGSNALVIGSAIFKQKDIGSTVHSFRQLISENELQS